jgi:YbbR domain-containing protein
MPQVTIPIEVESDASNYREIITPADRNIVVTVKGPKGAVDRIQQLFNNRPIKITLDKAVTSGGLKQIPTIRVGQDPRFVDAGITIESAQPDTISVMVEEYQDKEVPIQPRVRDPSREVTFEPPTVKVHAPRSKLEAMKKLTGDVLVAYAELPPVSQTADTDTVLHDVKISLPMTDPAVTIPPVSVTAKIKPTGMVEYIPDNVLLRVAATDQVLRDYDIAPLQPLHSPAVKLVGPREEIEKLQNGPAPRAFVELRPNVMPGENEADIHYDFGNRITIKEAPSTTKVMLSTRR